eukprot:EG_transcript_7017
MAEATFNRAAPYIPRIECLAESMDSEAEEHKARSLIFNYHFHCMEMHWTKGDRDVAFAVLTAKATKAASRVPADLPRLAHFTYGAALQLHNDHHWAAALWWLQATQELCQQRVPPDTALQARTYRMQANCHLEIGEKENALSLIDLANRLDPSAVGLFLEFKAKLQVGLHDVARDLLTTLLAHAECSAKVALSACNLLAPVDLDAAVAALDLAADRFHACRDDYFALKLRGYELLTASLERRHLDGALDVMAALLADAGHQGLPAHVLCNLCYGAWNVGLALMKSKTTGRTALQWLQYALRCTPENDTCERAKALRAIARTYLLLGDHTAGQQAVQEATALDPRCLHNYFLGFQLACALGDPPAARAALEGLRGAEGGTAETFAVLASVAFESERPALAQEALEHFIALHDGEAKKKATVLRNLCLCLEAAHPHPDVEHWGKVAEYCERLLDLLQVHELQSVLGDGAQDLRWWHATAWNAAT